MLLISHLQSGLTEVEGEMAFRELIWNIGTCAEAIHLLGEMDECPVCLRKKSPMDGYLHHKSSELLVN